MYFNIYQILLIVFIYQILLTVYFFILSDTTNSVFLYQILLTVYFFILSDTSDSVSRELVEAGLVSGKDMIVGEWWKNCRYFISAGAYIYT